MGKVINFRGKLSTAESVENLIREAEAGNIESVGVVIVTKDGDVITDYAMEDGASKFMLAGAVDRLKSRFWNEQFD